MNFYFQSMKLGLRRVLVCLVIIDNANEKFDKFIVKFYDYADRSTDRPIDRCLRPNRVY